MQPTDALDLRAYRWQNRLVLLFAPSSEDEAYAAQLRMFEGLADEFEDRDLLIFHLFTKGQGRLAGEALAEGAAADLRRQFDVAEDSFTLLLIGKDGGVKRRADAPVQPNDLFGQIDAMPMRQREMREAGD